MSLHEQEESLEAMLRAEDPYIEDAGFTARVMERLPARRRPFAHWRVTILLAAGAAPALVLLLNRPLGAELDRAFAAMQGAPSLSTLPFASVVMLAMLLWAGVTAVERE